MNFKCCAKSTAEEKEVSQTYEFLKVVADKNRLKILCLLRNGEKCVCQIFPSLNISQKLTSHHLGQLKKMDLLNERREGNFIYYSLNKKSIKNFKLLFNKLIK